MKSTSDLKISRIGNALSKNIHNFCHRLSAVKNALEINGNSSANCMSFNSEIIAIKTESLINTRQTNTSDELLSSHLRVELGESEHSLLTLRNLTNLSNKVYADQLYPGFYIPGEGRTAKVSLAYRF